MNIDEAYGSYWKVENLGGGTVQVVIASIDIEDIGEGDKKPVVRFQNHDRGLVLNVTNKERLKALWGPETDHWIGKIIELYAEPTTFQGKQVMGLRVRQPGQQAVPQNGPQQPPVPDGPPVPNDSIPF